MFFAQRDRTGVMNLENGEGQTSEYTNNEVLYMMHTDNAVYSIATQKIGTGNTQGMSGTVLSPLRLRLRKKTQLVSYTHDLETGAIGKPDIISDDWPKGTLHLSHFNSNLFALLDSTAGLSLY